MTLKPPDPLGIRKANEVLKRIEREIEKLKGDQEFYEHASEDRPNPSSWLGKFYKR